MFASGIAMTADGQSGAFPDDHDHEHDSRVRPLIADCGGLWYRARTADGTGVKGARYIVVEGPIGVGKTTLARLLAEEFNARPILEQVEENPFLKKFYDDPGTYAFQAQLFFLLSRYRQQRQLAQQDLFRSLRRRTSKPMNWPSIGNSLDSLIRACQSLIWLCIFRLVRTFSWNGYASATASTSGALRRNTSNA